MKKIEHEAAYTVGEGQVHLRVVIGEGQFGSTLVTAGSKVFDQARTFEGCIGLGAELRGKDLNIFSVVTDTNLQTNRTSVTYVLTGGPSPSHQTLAFSVEHEHDSVQYIARVKLN
jgi:hypothetical protein